ncbi:MAG: haloacid dehalogenase type II [Pseudomonadota bacterium]
MPYTLAFDVYGTLIDTNGVVTTLEEVVGDCAAEVSRIWREKQLEYSFRRGLMGAYRDFSVCTHQALDYALSVHDLVLQEAQHARLLDSYKKLPAFGDVRQALGALCHDRHRLFGFSNGRADAVEGLLQNAGIADFFDGIVSVDDVKSFKPDVAVYQHFQTRSQVRARDAWLVSGNSFDVIGAINADWNAIWVQRSEHSRLDPWDITPTGIVTDLLQISDILESH